MSTLGIVLLIHDQFPRAEQVIRHWLAGGCPVVVHVDARSPEAPVAALRARLADCPDVRFSRRFRCDWGTWGIVAATQAAVELLLATFPEVRHVYLASGACLPLRPVAELRRYLDARPTTDFIESATTADVPWTQGGLSEERFTLRFPFSWKTRRRAFDWYVGMQRRVGFRRRVPPGVVPHLGSQWWCLTRATLQAILESPERPARDRYFRRVWIPDESYFQSLVRLHSAAIESRSLTLSNFDFQGKPHMFYDDHLPLLRRSDCFVARKIWPRADALYRAFLGGDGAGLAAAEPNPGKIDRIFGKATERRTRGRAGLVMQSRHPNEGWENGVTSARYAMLQGLAELVEEFETWLARATGLSVHGHLFAPGRVAFEGGQTSFAGALSDGAALRDHDAWRFLTNLVWNTRGQRQCFQFGPGDNQAIVWPVAKDPNAEVAVVSGAWAVPLWRAGGDFAVARTEAARLQRIEAEHLGALRSPYAKARVRIWTMAEFVEAPMQILQPLVDEIGAPGRQRLAEAPRLVDLTGFGEFLQALKNQGMHPHLMGDFPVTGAATSVAPRPRRRPYLVRQGTGPGA